MPVADRARRVPGGRARDLEAGATSRSRALSLAATLVVAAETFRGEPVPAAPWRDYVTLTKPRIMTLLLLTGAAGMFVGARGRAAARDSSSSTMVGLALACGGASALNHVLDRDLDRLMGRTGHRPVAEERVTPERARSSSGSR